MNIIFDLDGTIGNTLPLCIAAFRRALEPCLGRSLSDDEISAHFGRSEEGIIAALAGDSYNTAIESYLDWYRRLHFKYPAPFEGIPEILNYLCERGAFVGMVTGKGARSTLITLEKYRLKDHFDLIKTGSPLGSVKQQGFEEIISARCDPKESYLYIGDSPSDIDECRAVGIKIAAVGWAETSDVEELKKKGPDYLFEKVPDLRAFITQKQDEFQRTKIRAES